jgi:hypothetical protein
MNKNIFQIYHDKSCIPDYIGEYLLTLNPDHKYHLFNFDEGKEIIRQHFDAKGEIICDKLDSIPRYCHQSDLLRYCLLYIFGGVYIDCDLKPLISFDEMLPTNITFLSSFGVDRRVRNARDYCRIMANGIMISKKENPMLMDLINICLQTDYTGFAEDRGTNVYALYTYMSMQCILCDKIGKTFKPFETFVINDNNVYMLGTMNKDSPNCIVDENYNVIIDPNIYDFKRQTSGNI